MANLEYDTVFDVIQSGLDGENLEKLSMESTVLNVYYIIHTRCKFTQKPRVANCVRVRRVLVMGS